MRRSCNVRHLLEDLQVIGMASKLIVSDEGTKRGTAQHAKSFIVDFFEHRALIEFGGFPQVFQQISLGDIEDLDLQHGRGFRLKDEILQATPGGFQPLKGLGVHDFVELVGQSLVDCRDAGIKHRFRVG